jgi:hypothetical protein
LEIANPAANSLEAQQRRTKKWVRSFNDDRPLEALGMKTPSEIYVASELKYHRVSPLEYGAEFELRLVNSKGDNFETPQGEQRHGVLPNLETKSVTQT